jgi:hypothetical protein
MRLSSASFASPSHDGPNWSFVRRQLSIARTSRISAASPPLPLLALELEMLASEWRGTGNLPLRTGREGRGAYESLGADLQGARHRAGEHLLTMAGPLLGELEAALGAAERPTDEILRCVLENGAMLASTMRSPEATVAAFDDILAGAAQLNGDDDLDAFESLLDSFRAAVELRGLQWHGVQQTIVHLLSVSTNDPDGYPLGGPLPRGTTPEDVLLKVHTYLRRPPALRKWTVWLATKAGPGDHREPLRTIIGNGIVVCGVACVGDISQWLEDARSALTAAYGEGRLPVPGDVASLGEPAYYDGDVLLDSEELWRSLAAPRRSCRGLR